MKLFRNVRLKVLFFIMSAIVSGIIFVISSYNIFKNLMVHEKIKYIKERPFQRTKLVYKIAWLNEEIHAKTVKYIFFRDELLKSQLRKDLIEKRELQTRLLKDLEDVIDRKEKGLNLYHALITEEGNYRKELESVVNLALKGVSSEIIEKEFITQVIPKIRVLRLKFQDYTNYQVDLLDETISDIVLYSDFNSVVNFSSLVLMIITSFLAGYIASKIVRTQLLEINQITEELARGNLLVHIESFGKNEFEEIKTSLLKTKNNLFDVISSIRNCMLDLLTKANGMEKISQKFTSMAQKQAASSEESSASLDELNSSFENVVSFVKNSNQKLKNINTKTQNLNKSLQEVNLSLRAIVNQAESGSRLANSGKENIYNTNSSMKNISDISQQISSLVGLITEISEQTNLLALNASIEAARAGEFGRGFSVVATEVAKLADRTASNVKDIKQLIQSVSHAVKQGEQNVSQTSKFFESIIQSIEKISSNMTNIRGVLQEEFHRVEEIAQEIDSSSQLVSEIDVAIVEQKQAAHEINKLAQNLTQDAQQLSISAETLKLDASDLKNIARKLENKINFFKIS